LRFALSLKERHRSQNEELKSEEQLSNFKEQCAQLCQHPTFNQPTTSRNLAITETSLSHHRISTQPTYNEHPTIS